MDINSQFIIVLNKMGLTKYRAAIDLGTSPTQLAKIEGGRDPNIHLVNKMIGVYGINPMWMFLGQGEMLLADEQKRLGIVSGDTEGLSVSEINLKVDNKNKTVSVVNEPEAPYADKKQTVQFDIVIEKNEIKEISGVRIVESKEFDL